MKSNNLEQGDAPTSGATVVRFLDTASIADDPSEDGELVVVPEVMPADDPEPLIPTQPPPAPPTVVTKDVLDGVPVSAMLLRGRARLTINLTKCSPRVVKEIFNYVAGRLSAAR